MSKPTKTFQTKTCKVLMYEIDGEYQVRKNCLKLIDTWIKEHFPINPPTVSTCKKGEFELTWSMYQNTKLTLFLCGCWTSDNGYCFSYVKIMSNQLEYKDYEIGTDVDESLAQHVCQAMSEILEV